MSLKNVTDIREILTSIEALKEQADHLHEMHGLQDNVFKQGSSPASLFDDMAARKSDVVLLEDVYRKGVSQQECKGDSPALAAHQKVKSRLAPGLKSFPSDDEFDRMLSTLLKDMEHQSKKTGISREPKLSVTGNAATRDLNELTNIEADIDNLLSPYLNSSEASSHPQPTTSSKSPYIKKVKEQQEPQQRARQKDLIDNKLLSALITDEMRTEITDYILAEIKKQISGWIAENLENIVEEALRSVSTEARDAVKARSVR